MIDRAPLAREAAESFINARDDTCGAIGVPMAQEKVSRLGATMRAFIPGPVAGSPVSSAQATPTDEKTS